MTEKPISDLNVYEMWVNITEAAEILGYHRKTILKLAVANWKMPVEERAIRLDRRSHGYMIWLPDLIRYSEQKWHAPQPKRKHLST
jgi:hypothetical protein